MPKEEKKYRLDILRCLLEKSAMIVTTTDINDISYLSITAGR